MNNPAQKPAIFDAILVDDDPLVESTWRLLAKKAGKRLSIFTCGEELLAKVDNFDVCTPVYIDFALPQDKMQGVELARELHRRGFRELYLSTGQHKDDIPAVDVVKEIRGKNPPWKI